MYKLSDFAKGEFDTALMAKMYSLELFERGLCDSEVFHLLRAYVVVVRKNLDTQDQRYTVEQAREALAWGKAEAKAETKEAPESADFFDVQSESRPFVVEGVIREKQLAILAGSFAVGKSPLLVDIAYHTSKGLEWLGRKVSKRPVVVFDFETDAGAYRGAWRSKAARTGEGMPKVPGELEVYLLMDEAAREPTKRLIEALKTDDEGKVRFVLDILSRKPDSLIIIDPVELMFDLGRRDSRDVLKVYSCLRTILVSYPQSAILATMNLRKRDKRVTMPSLYRNPREWLEEVSGSATILNRVDVRLGMDEEGEDEVKVFNGIIRGEGPCSAMVLRSTEHEGKLAGFEREQMDELGVRDKLTVTQQGWWDTLPERFSFEEAVKLLKINRGNLSRFLASLKSLGAVKIDSKVGRTAILVKQKLGS